MDTIWHVLTLAWFLVCAGIGLFLVVGICGVTLLAIIAAFTDDGAKEKVATRSGGVVGRATYRKE
jgi:hypothetical protein